MDGTAGRIETESAATAMEHAAIAGLRWYALHVVRGAEYRVRRWLDRAPPAEGKRSLVPLVARDFRSARQLERAGHELWLPECVVVRSTRKSREVSRAMPWFPGYLFIRLDLAAHDWRTLEEVDGVITLLLEDGHPCALADERIAGLRAACNPETGVAEIGVPSLPEYAKEQKLRVLSGPFAGFDALFSDRVKDRVRAMLEIFGRLMPVTFEEAQIEAAS